MTDLIRRHEAREDGRCKHCNSTLPRPDVVCVPRWPADAPLPEAYKGRVVAAEDVDTINRRMTEIRRDREQAAANRTDGPVAMNWRDFTIFGSLP
jgi:hypothetical protein